MTHALTLLANRVAALVGHCAATALALFLVAGWGIAGSLLGISDTWLVLGGTASGVVAFVMVFLIQRTQQRDAVAVHRKLDELLQAVGAANAGPIRVEEGVDARRVEPKRLAVAPCEVQDALRARPWDGAQRRARPTQGNGHGDPVA